MGTPTIESRLIVLEGIAKANQRTLDAQSEVIKHQGEVIKTLEHRLNILHNTVLFR